MPPISVTARQGAPEETSADTRVVGLFEGESPPAGPVGRAFRLYFERLLPLIGGLVSGDREAYGYLPRSVGAFMGPGELAARMATVGFVQVRYRLQTFGVSALHVGVRAPAGPVGGR